MRTLYRAVQRKDGSIRIEERVVKGQPRYSMHYEKTKSLALKKGILAISRHMKKRRGEFEKMVREYFNLLESERNAQAS